MGLQIFSKLKWKDDSFNETNVSSVMRDAKKGNLRRRANFDQHAGEELVEQNSGHLPSIEEAKKEENNKE